VELTGDRNGVARARESEPGSRPTMPITGVG
jgi:hypothetical protein